MHDRRRQIGRGATCRRSRSEDELTGDTAEKTRPDSYDTSIVRSHGSVLAVVDALDGIVVPLCRDDATCTYQIVEALSQRKGRDGFHLRPMVFTGVIDRKRRIRVL